MEPELEVLEVAEKAVPCRQVTLVFLLHLELLILAAVVVAETTTTMAVAAGTAADAAA